MFKTSNTKMYIFVYLNIFSKISIYFTIRIPKSSTGIPYSHEYIIFSATVKWQKIWFPRSCIQCASSDMYAARLIISNYYILCLSIKYSYSKIFWFLLQMHLFVQDSSSSSTCLDNDRSIKLHSSRIVCNVVTLINERFISWKISEELVK